LEEAREIEQRFCDALASKDLEALNACFWDDPEVVLVFNGEVHRGPDAVSALNKAVFDQHESIKVEINDISLVPAGDGFMAVGTATLELTPLEGPPRLLVERWSDLRRKVDGRWVYVHSHSTHLPE